MSKHRLMLYGDPVETVYSAELPNGIRVEGDAEEVARAIMGVEERYWRELERKRQARDRDREENARAFSEGRIYRSRR